MLYYTTTQKAPFALFFVLSFGNFSLYSKKEGLASPHFLNVRPVRIELTTQSLKGSCSTTELRSLFRIYFAFRLAKARTSATLFFTLKFLTEFGIHNNANRLVAYPFQNSVEFWETYMYASRNFIKFRVTPPRFELGLPG
jgi:hypothetical protein